VGLVPGVQLVMALAILVALSVPLLMADAGPLTSDESLYVAEGLNLADGRGYTYPTGEAVHHRGPLFPALLALDFRVAGFSLDHALWVPKLFALASAALVVAAGWRFFGREAGLLAGMTVLASSLLSLMGASLFLDGAQTFFMLLTLLLLHIALKDGKPLMAGLSGAALGLAMLTKESALLWLPLPFVAILLLGPAASRPGKLLLAYSLGFLAVAGWWWPYVYAVTGTVYLLGDPPGGLAWLAGGAAGLAVLARVSMKFTSRSELGGLSLSTRWIGVGLLLAEWAALFLIGLERHSTWPFPAGYLHTVPDYTATVLASWVQPLPLIGVAWGYAGYRAFRGSLSDRLLLLGLLLFLPFALFVANRDQHVRDMLPIVYLSYLALARAAVDFVRWVTGLATESFSPAVGTISAAVLVVAALGWFAVAEHDRFAGERASFDAAVVQQEHWDNPLARDTATWIAAHVPAGTPIMSGRLYSTHMYSLTDGRFPWWQLPTVRVDFEGQPTSAVRASTLFRWEDHQMPDGPAEPWLYLRRYPVKGYYIGLSEQDLVHDLKEHEIGYVVLTGNDAGFSSLSLLSYFEDHPYFAKVKSFVVDDQNQVHIFRVLPALDAPISAPAVVDVSTTAALREELGQRRAHELLDGLSPGGYTAGIAYGVADSADEG
ncbi:MAG: glycosyltransferase family 39 protein, partial [Dehalococcoidia bacterium]